MNTVLEYQSELEATLSNAQKNEENMDLFTQRAFEHIENKIHPLIKNVVKLYNEKIRRKNKN